MMFQENSTTVRSSFANRSNFGPSTSMGAQEKMPILPKSELNKTFATPSHDLPQRALHNFPHNVGPSLNGDNSFSSSLPVSLQEKLNLHSYAGEYEYSNFGGSHVDGDFVEDALGPLDQEFIARAIGDLLPEDEEELLDGVAESLGFMHLNLEENDDFDLFSSGGGLELDVETQESFGPQASNSRSVDGFNGSSGVFHGPSVGPSPVSGEHPFGEHPSRTLFVRNINSNVEDSELRELFEQYGDIRTLYTACKHRGFVMISYYDIRSARSAMRALQNKPLRRRKLDIHFSIPKDNPSDKDMNQGTLVVFNLDASVSNDDLCQIFGQYGEIKEIRETPHKRHHKFIEFYDVRAAEAALRALNRSDIAGKRIKLEPSRPGGARRNLTQQLTQELEDEARLYRPQSSPPWAKSPSGHFSAWGHFGSPVESGLPVSFHQSLGGLRPATLKPSLVPMLSNSMLPAIRATHLGRSQFEGMSPFHTTSVGVKGSTLHHAHSLPEYTDNMALSSVSPPVCMSSLAKFHDGSDSSRLSRASLGLGNDVSWFERAPGAIGNSNGGSHSHSGSGSASLSGPQFLWGDSSAYGQTPSSAAWSTSPISHSFTPPGHAEVQQLGSQGHFVNAALSSRRFQYGSAPPGDPPFLERQHGLMRETDTSPFNPGLLGLPCMNTSTSRSIANFGSLGTAAGLDNCVSMSLGVMPSYRRSHMFQASGMPLAKNIDMLGDRGRNRRTESSTAQAENKKQYQLDIDAILRGEDERTTLMIKNIPNKYTSKMLLAAIDENHRGMYDFMYLPIDFKNKCNVGYAFINMTSPAYIISIYETFNGKKWEKFNSEKVASLAYARIQGKAALVAHFENSSLMNEDKRCRPILFQSDGTDIGDQFGTGELEVASFQDGPPAASVTSSPGLEAE